MDSLSQTKNVKKGIMFYNDDDNNNNYLGISEENSVKCPSCPNYQSLFDLGFQVICAEIKCLCPMSTGWCEQH